MDNLVFRGLPTNEVSKLQNGGKDSYGHETELHISDGNDNPCRHCLGLIDEGDEFLVLAHRPFSSLQPYAETGPIFLHKQECSAYIDQGGIPDILYGSDQYIMRGYDEDERIIYGTGTIVANMDLRRKAGELFQNEKVSFIHIRSASNNCYQARIDRD